ncbi:MAG: DUF1648 domain-containing protein [Candidatus Zixiibacteriota bacterium]
MGLLKPNRLAAKNERPRPDIPRTRVDFAFEIIAVVGLLTGLFNLIFDFSKLPESIPTHFNFKGDADNWGGKDSLWILAGLLVVIYVSLSLVPRIPHLYNYPFEITNENAERQYRLARQFITLLKAEIVWLFTAIIGSTIQVALGESTRLQPTLLFLFLALIAASTIGYFILAYRAK